MMSSAGFGPFGFHRGFCRLVPELTVLCVFSILLLPTEHNSLHFSVSGMIFPVTCLSLALLCRGTSFERPSHFSLCEMRNFVILCPLGVRFSLSVMNLFVSYFTACTPHVLVCFLCHCDKHCDPKEFRGRKGLFSLTGLSVERNQERSLKQELWRNTEHSFALRGLLSSLSYITQHHLSRGSTIHSQLDSPTSTIN